MRKAMLAAMGMLITATPAFASWDFKIMDGPLGKKVGVATLADDQGEIVVRCDTTGQNSLFLTIHPRDVGEGLEPDFMRATTYRIDNGPARTVNAIYDADEITIVNLVRGLMGGNLLFSMLASKRLSLEIVDKTNRNHSLQFETEGAQTAVMQTAQACHDTNWISLKGRRLAEYAASADIRSKDPTHRKPTLRWPHGFDILYGYGNFGYFLSAAGR